MSLAKILKNCPKGMKLYSPIYGEVEFAEVTALTESIGCKINSNTVYFHSDGSYYKGGECMLFPSKEQRDWDDFMIPFRDGDVIIRTEPNLGCKQCNIAIFRNYNIDSTNKMTIHCQVNGANEFKTSMCVDHRDWRLANYEEIKRFFTRMHESGYDFKEGELITLPKFKAGDTITNGKLTLRIDVVDSKYYIEGYPNVAYRLPISDQHHWRLKKFDISSLKPYDKVLVRNGDGCWYPTLVSYITSSKEIYLIDTTNKADRVIPFEGNERLIGTFSDPDPYYITWDEDIC